MLVLMHGDDRQLDMVLLFLDTDGLSVPRKFSEEGLQCSLCNYAQHCFSCLKIIYQDVYIAWNAKQNQQHTFRISALLSKIHSSWNPTPTLDSFFPWEAHDSKTATCCLVLSESLKLSEHPSFTSLKMGYHPML